MGLRKEDLKDLVFNVFDIDKYKSKMGEDRDVCVLSFRIADRNPARDLMEFVEKGYDFVLDSDVSAGEDQQGTYHVFVEIPRDELLPIHIKEISEDLTLLTGNLEWKFRYYKDSQDRPIKESVISEMVPTSPEKYDTMIESRKTFAIENFFNKTFKDRIVIENNNVTISKPFGMSINFKINKFTEVSKLQKDITETIKVDSESMSQVLWLTKILGDYNITKYGDEFILENNGNAMVIEVDH